MDTWGEDLAIFTPKSMHEAKMLPERGLIARIRGKGDAYGAILASWALGPPQCKEGMRGFMGRRGGRRRWRVRVLRCRGATVRGHGAGGCCARGRWWARRTRQWWVLRCRGAAGRHDGAGAACGGTVLVGAACGGANGRGAAGGATLVTALEPAAQQAQWKRVAVGREESGLARRNTPARVAAIRPSWRALPRRALRALR